MTARMQAALIGIAACLLFLTGCVRVRNLDLPSRRSRPKRFGNILINRTSRNPVSSLPRSRTGATDKSSLAAYAISSWSSTWSDQCDEDHGSGEPRRENIAAQPVATMGRPPSAIRRPIVLRSAITGTSGTATETFDKLKKLPKTKYGNEINWVKALDERHDHAGELSHHQAAGRHRGHQTH